MISLHGCVWIPKKKLAVNTAPDFETIIQLLDWRHDFRKTFARNYFSKDEAKRGGLRFA